MNILITGASGFVGTHLVESLAKAEKPATIHCVTFRGHNLLADFITKKNIYELDLFDGKKIDQLVQAIKPDQVVHLAALAAVGESFKNPKKVLENNIIISLNLLEAVKKYAKKAAVLFIGSADEYGKVRSDQVPIDEQTELKPTSPYAVSKVAVDYLGLQYFLAYKLRIIRLRPFNQIGEYQGLGFVVSDFAKQIVEAELDKEKTIKVGNLDAVRDFTDVKDMVKAYSLALKKCKPGEVYNVGSGNGISIKQVLDILLSKAKRKITVEVDKSKYRPVDAKSIVADSTKFRKVTGWKPTIPLEETLERVINYWRRKL